MNDDNKQVRRHAEEPNYKFQIHWINLKVQTIQRQICPYLFASEVPQYASGLPQTAPVGESEQEKISAVVVESFCWPAYIYETIEKINAHFQIVWILNLNECHSTSTKHFQPIESRNLAEG